MMASESDLEQRVRAAFQDKLKMMKIPEKDDDFLPSACCLLEKRRELARVEENLSARKEEFQMKMEVLQHRQQGLEQKKAQLREAVLKFDKFLKDNDAKRHRALRKAGQEHQQVAQRETEVARLRQEIARLTSIKAKLQQCLSGYRIFPEYLRKVLEKMEQFQEIPELIGQFQTLMATQATLVQRELAGREAVEEARANLRAYVEESSNELLQQNNHVAELQSRLEQARTRVLAGESNWICIQNTAAEKTLELGRIKLAVMNLFQMVAKYRKLPANVPQDDTEAQLDAVQLCIEDLMDILSNFRKEETTTILPSEWQTGPQSEPEPSWHPSLSVDLWKDTESSSQRSQRSRVT